MGRPKGLRYFVLNDSAEPDGAIRRAWRIGQREKKCCWDLVSAGISLLVAIVHVADDAALGLLASFVERV